MFDITASIVTYCNDPKVLMKTVNSFLDTELKVKLYISDNSPTNELKRIFEDSRIEYFYNNKNLGFGKAHNICIRKAKKVSPYHLVLNPDVYFDNKVLGELINYLNKNEDVGLIAPKILYPNNDLQYSCRLIPSPFDMIIRRVPLLKRLFNKRIQIQELSFTGYNIILNVPFLLGAFHMFRTDLMYGINGYDQRFFMYMEDLDFCRRIRNRAKVVFYPHVSIFHYYEKGSKNNLTLFTYHLISMIKYFNKWGWLLDKDRRSVNRSVKCSFKGNEQY